MVKVSARFAWKKKRLRFVKLFAEIPIHGKHQRIHVFDDRQGSANVFHTYLVVYHIVAQMQLLKKRICFFFFTHFDVAVFNLGHEH